MVIPLVREKNRNYIILKDKKLAISDINGLINLENVSSMLELIKKLNNKKIIKSLEVEDIGLIIKLGEEFHEQQKQREADLKTRMEKLLNVKENSVNLSTGQTRQGYLVAGNWKTYFIDSSTAEAFSYPDGARICMITKHDTTAKTENVMMRVFERAMVLKNDSVVADRVETLKVYNKLTTEEIK